MATLTATTAAVLRPVADILVLIATLKVHPTLFPYPIASTLHAARISVAFQANVRKSNSQLSWGTYITGYLIMCWGGTFISHFLLSIPPPPLYSVHPYINYLSVHLLLSVVFKLFPPILNPKILDTFLFPLDALVRTNAITSTVALLSPPPHSPSSSVIEINPLLTDSILFHFFLGAIASSGGGVTAATVGTWNPHWSVGTPVFLRSGVGWLGSVDVWGGGLVALIYSGLLAHPASHVILTHPAVQALGVEAKPALSPLAAKAAGAVVLGVLFGIRVWRVHWIGNQSGMKPKMKTP